MLSLFKCKSAQKNVFLQVFLPLLFFLLSTNCAAQLPLQDGEGEGTLLTNRRGFLQFNIAESTAHFGYMFDNTKNDFSFGVDFSAKVTGKKASFINNNSFAPDAGFAFSVGKKFLFSREYKPDKKLVTEKLLAEMQKILEEDPDVRKMLGKDTVKPGAIKLPTIEKLKELLKSAGLNEEEQNLGSKPPTLSLYINALTKYCVELKSKDAVCQNKDTIFNTIFSPKGMKTYGINFDRLVFRGGYSYKKYDLFDPARPFDDQLYEKNFHKPSAEIIYFSQIGGNKLFGISGGVERTNNSSALTEVEVRDFTTIVNGNDTREFGGTTTALMGSFKESTRAFINSDFAWFPGKFNSLFGVDFFVRSGLTGRKSLRPGVGFFFSEKGAPTHVIGGINLSVDNKGKLNVALIAGYNF